MLFYESSVFVGGNTEANRAGMGPRCFLRAGCTAGCVYYLTEATIWKKRLETSHYKSYIIELTARISAYFYLNHESSCSAVQLH